MQISPVRRSDKTSRRHPRHVVPKPGRPDETEVPVQMREWIAPALASPDLALVAQAPTQLRRCVGAERPVDRPRPRPGASPFACAFLVYMLPPLPRRSDWASCFAQPPRSVSLPRYGSRVGLRIDLFGACSAFTRVAACKLALPPVRGSRCSKASAISLPP